MSECPPLIPSFCWQTPAWWSRVFSPAWVLQPWQRWPSVNPSWSCELLDTSSPWHWASLKLLPLPRTHFGRACGGCGLLWVPHCLMPPRCQHKKSVDSVMANWRKYQVTVFWRSWWIQMNESTNSLDLGQKKYKNTQNSLCQSLVWGSSWLCDVRTFSHVGASQNTTRSSLFVIPWLKRRTDFREHRPSVLVSPSVWGRREVLTRAPALLQVLAALCNWLALGGSCRSLTTTHRICCVCQASGEMSNLLCIWIFSFCFLFFSPPVECVGHCVKESTTYQHKEPHRPGSPASLADWASQTVKAAVLRCCKI